jgi:hypothetical protein
MPFTGLRIKEEQMRQWGMTSPGLRQRATAISELPAVEQARAEISSLPSYHQPV